MTPAVTSREVVLQYYRSFYRQSGMSEFVCRGNEFFMHPVLTPNFFSGGKPQSAQIGRDRLHFAVDLGQSRHWMQLYEDQIDEELLGKAGYRQTMSCMFNVFTKPIAAKPVAGFDFQFIARIPGGIRAEYEQKTDANCHNLPPVVLRRIEQVLRESAEQVGYALAFSREHLAAALTIVRSGGITLFVNAWVDHPERHKGIITALYAAALAQELREGQRAVFYWTFNPLIAARGNQTDLVRVFEMPTARPQ